MDANTHLNNLKTRRLSQAFLIITLMLALLAGLTSCGVYTFNDKGTIPQGVRTVFVPFIENRAPYVNQQLSPTLTERLKLKILSQTRLTNTTSDTADFVVTCEIRDYSVSTTGVNNNGQNGRQQSSINRLNVSVHIIAFDRVNNITKEHDITRNFDFSAELTLQDAERRLLDEIIRNLTDEIFNRLFSDW